MVMKTGQAYAYTGDDPVNGTDPSGEHTTLVDVGGINEVFPVDTSPGAGANITVEHPKDHLKTGTWSDESWGDSLTGGSINVPYEDLSHLISYEEEEKDAPQSSPNFENRTNPP